MEDSFKGMQNFSTKFENFTQLNDRFSTVSVKLMYSGVNRNRTYFSKDIVEQKIQTLANMPIVGEFSEEQEDFKGHGGKMVVTDDNISFVRTTKPYGVVPESFTYEWINDDIGDGRIKETLVIHNVILWTKHYAEAWKVIQNHSSQSMEIDILNGEWDEDSELYKVSDFNFLALCILGENVSPAFENSHFYSLDSFKDEFKEMLTEFKQYTLNEKEDNDLEPKKEVVEQETTDTAEPKTEETVEETQDQVETEVESDTSEDQADQADQADNEETTETKDQEDPEGSEDNKEQETTITVEEYDLVKNELDSAKAMIAKYEAENKELADFKESILRERHENDYAELLGKYRLDRSDVVIEDIHQYSLSELDEKLKVVIADKVLQGTYSLSNDEEAQAKTNKINMDVSEKKKNNPYEDLFEEFG